MKNPFLNEFTKREYFNQCTNISSLDQLLNKNKIKGYIGFDCTAPSLHIGSLLQIMCLRLLQKHGHRPIILLGGGTTMIGDPSGKEETRKILKIDQIRRNAKNIEKILNIFLKTNDKRTKPIFVNNADWLLHLNYIKFLRDIGKFFTINKMLSYDSVKLRLEREQSLSYMEFNYMILQAYDFYELFKKKKCILQIGGSDQWGNIINGVDLIRRLTGKESFGLTTPLITLASGVKMGKTETGAIWLDKNLLSAYDYWQFWRNVDDKDVIRFIKMFTDISLEKIEEIKNFDINKLKILLANETTSLLHGKKAANKSEITAKNTFLNKNIGSELPVYKINQLHAKKGLKIIDLVFSSKLLNSKSEARRAIKNKGIKINNNLVEIEDLIINENFFLNKVCKLSFGKKKHIIIKLD